MSTCDIAIVGAGPYGLSAAAHLRAVKGLEIRVFGEPMSFWERHMPVGMLLRSPWAASHLADPGRTLTLDAYQAVSGKLSAPIPIDRFVDYGRWFQRHAVPQVEARNVVRIELDHAGFRLVLDRAEVCRARRVVIAAGIVPFAWRPPEFDGLTAPHVSHACEQRDLRQFAGKRVAVIGGGQSALESTALLHEAGADVETLVRQPQIHWLSRSARLHRLGPISRLLYHPSDVGPAGVSQLIARPNLFRQLPRRWQDPLGVRSIRPAGSAWLRPRLTEVPLRAGQSVASAAAAGDGVSLRLNDGSERRVDHVLLATGYRVDISRYAFLAEDLLHRVERINGFPRLNAGFESSVSGLHFLGAPAAWSFGPLMRFVAGAPFSAGALTRRIAGKAASWAFLPAAPAREPAQAQR
jgi:lysine/ornithine N-monooxygenase